MAAPLVSVIIPSYNYGRFIGDALDSVLAQSYVPTEVIVVDDGSTDDTIEILARYGDRIRVLRQDNSGPSVARNLGIEESRGPYLAFLDADDVWMPEKLSRQVALIESSADTGAVGCSVQYIDARAQVTGGRIYAEQVSTPIDLDAQLREIAVRTFLIGGSGSGALVRREVFASVGTFDATLRSAEDWDLWLRIASRYPIRNVPETLVSIRRHRDSLRLSATERWQVYRCAFERWPATLERVRTRMKGVILANIASEYVDLGDTKMALRCYLESLRYHPGRARSWHAAASLLVRRLRRTKSPSA